MPSTHSSLHYHLVFSTKHREPWLRAVFRPKLHAYLGGTIRGIGGVAHAVGGVSDHVHILAGLTPKHRLSDVMREVKAESSRWIKRELLSPGFAWQEGYGAFTLDAGNLRPASEYVLNQESHHRQSTFQDEYISMLKRGMVEFDERYLW